MRGDMNMRGDMKMGGEMKMDGELSTVIRTDNTASRLVSVPVYGGSQAGHGRVCVVDIDGLLVNKNMSGMGSMGENPVALFREKLDAIAADPTVRAIVLRINSSGGGVTASDMMSRDLEQIIKSKSIPVVACIMEAGAGGAYYLAVGADRVVAQPTALVGGIGVILNVYNLEDMMGQFGIAAMPVKVGDRIDMGSPLRPMEEAERAAMKGLANQFHQRFKQRVQQCRQVAEDNELFDGRVVTGIEAKDLGLVDEVGYLDNAIMLARQLAGLPECSPIVMLRRDNDRAFTAFDVTPNTPTMSSILPLKVPGLDRASLPTFLYLWQPEPTNQ
jgi:protease IV